MGIFEVVNPEKTLLPITVPDTNILGVLQQLRFDPKHLEQEVSVTYVTGVLDMYKDAIVGYASNYSAADIIGDIIQTNIPVPSSLDGSQVRARISSYPWHRVLSPPKIPWALYELVAESVRVELAKVEELRDYTTPTMFPFLLGVYSMVSHPVLVAQSRIQSIEGLIGAVNRFGKKLNDVTEMKTVPSETQQRELLTAQFQRTQHSDALLALETRLKGTGISSQHAQEIARAICYRDLATTVGALVGGSILKNQRIRYTEVDGDPLTEGTIRIYYPAPTGDSNLSLADAWHLARTVPGNSWRQRYISAQLETAVAPLQAVALRKSEKEKLDLREQLIRMEEASTRIKQLRQVAREASHHVKNPASALLGILRRLSPDEHEIFKELYERETIGVEGHTAMIKEMATVRTYSLEGLRGPEVPKMLGRRYEAYTARFAETYTADSIPLARRIFDVMCGTYAKSCATASIPILDGLVTRMETQPLDPNETAQFVHHYKRVKIGMQDAERLTRAIITRTKGFGNLAKDESTKDLTSEPVDLLEAITAGLSLLKTQPDTPEIIIEVPVGTTPFSHRETLESAIENVTWNAYEALQGKPNLDPTFKGEALVLFYDRTRNALYIGNSGPAIPDHRITAIFTYEGKGAGARTALKQEAGSGTSMTLKRDLLRTVGNGLECYPAARVAEIRAEYPLFAEHKVNVVFGITFGNKS